MYSCFSCRTEETAVMWVLNCHSLDSVVARLQAGHPKVGLQCGGAEESLLDSPQCPAPAGSVV
jgi:hypothetical protein